MFVIEKIVNDQRSAVERWESARDKWVNAADYRYAREYEESHPRPGYWVKKTAKAVLVGVLIGVMFVLIMGFAKEVKISNDNKPKEAVAQTEGKSCRKFNKDDHVRIQYGDFTGNNGVIVGGCEESEEYQVKIDPNSKANVGNDGNEGPVDVSGWIIKVNDEDNLVVVELPEEKKE